MRRTNDGGPTCAEARAELVALLYGELEGEPRDAVEAHLERCEACRSELAELGAARDALDAWSPPAGAGADADAADLARRIAHRPRRPSRVRPALVGLAAAVVAFAGLALAGAEVERKGGRVTLSLAVPFADAPEPRAQAGDAAVARPIPAAWREEMRAIAFREAERSAADVTRERDERLEAWSLREEERRLDLVRAIDEVRERDRERVEAVLATLHEGARRESRFTRDALLELASHVATDVP